MKEFPAHLRFERIGKFYVAWLVFTCDCCRDREIARITADFAENHRDLHDAWRDCITSWFQGEIAKISGCKVTLVRQDANGQNMN
jgi:hypothetical protein